MKTSNKFTLSRIILAPVIFVLYYFPMWLNLSETGLLSKISICIAIPLLAWAEFTDFLDGHYARKANEVSDFGKMFDPFADVFLHLSMFACFVYSGYMPMICFVLILYREFAQSFLRMVAAKKGVAIAARKGGKLKTVVYVSSCFMAFIQEFLIRMDFASNLPMDILKYVGWFLFGACVVLSYVSFVDYLINFGSILKEESK